MTLNELISIVRGKSTLNSDKKIGSIKTDTRDIKKNDVFIALKGKNFDGNDFLDEAIKKGAICAITDCKIGEKYIKVNNTLDSLFDIARYMKDKYNIPLIAITGSNGKTTTKDLIYHILSSKYNVLKNEGSKNNIIGVSSTLFKLNEKNDIIVMEFGTNHLGEIKKLSLMARPDMSIITNIGSSHLEYFKSRKNIFKEKYSITSGMINSNLIVNGDDSYLKNIDAIKCGVNKNNDLKCYNIKSYIDRVEFNIKKDKEYKVIFNNPGKHFIIDILLAINVCEYYGIDIDTIIDRISTFKISDKRMNFIKLKNSILINDSYNASLESTKAGINYMKDIDSNKIFILGDILELGSFSIKMHKKINKMLKKIKNKDVLTIGNYSKYIKGKNFKSIDDLINYLDGVNITDSYIYVKGSRKMGLDNVVEYLKKR